MKSAGIVCEYNPFHNGHKRQIEILREAGYDCIVCAMSGNFTQRGEFAIADKYARAKAAILGDVDLILELPFPFSCFSAEGFARAGVHILSSVGVDTLSFGSESADIELLSKAADLISSEKFIDSYSEMQKTGSASGFFELLEQYLGDGCKLLSNDILAISYMLAIKEFGNKMSVYPIKREGSRYNDTALSGRFPSATAVRKAVKDAPDGFLSLSTEYLPQGSLRSIQESQNHGLAPVFVENIGDEILSFFKLMTPAEISARAVSKSGGKTVADDGCGIVERLCRSARSASAYSEFLTEAYNSRFTDARINRVILFSLLGVSDKLIRSLPEYTTLLAASDTGRRYLSNIRKDIDFPIITKPADSPDGTISDISRLADSLYSSAIPKEVGFDYFIKAHPFINL